MDPTKWDVPFPAIVAALYVVVFFRANATYWLGRLIADGLHHTRFAKVMDSPKYSQAIKRINAYGSLVVTLSFLTVGFQTIANLAAGATHMRLRQYLPAMMLGGIFWALIYASLGTLGGEFLVFLWAISPGLVFLAGLCILAIIAAYITWRRLITLNLTKAD